MAEEKEIIEEEKITKPFAQAFKDFVHSPEVLQFIMSTLKTAIPNITGGAVKPIKCEAEKDKSMNMDFEIATDEDTYKISVVVKKTKNGGVKYTLSIHGTDSSYVITYEEIRSEGSSDEEE